MWFLDMERAFLRSASVVPEGEDAAPAAPGGDEPGGAFMVTETWMLILSEGSTVDGSELGLDDGEDGDPASSPLTHSLKNEKAKWQAVT